jgi:hypothetical protein
MQPIPRERPASAGYYRRHAYIITGESFIAVRQIMETCVHTGVGAATLKFRH